MEYTKCRKCGSEMARISPQDTSPLIVECQACGHREYAEVQISPPWPPQANPNSTKATKRNKTGKRRLRFLDLSATPVSVGTSDEETTVLPVGWILLWIIILAFAGSLLWIIFS